IRQVAIEPMQRQTATRHRAVSQTPGAAVRVRIITLLPDINDPNATSRAIPSPAPRRRLRRLIPDHHPGRLSLPAPTRSSLLGPAIRVPTRLRSDLPVRNQPRIRYQAPPAPRENDDQPQAPHLLE